jgi:general secretion pathway protein G
MEKRKNSEAGWTFIETIIVIGIILILTSSVGFMAVKYIDKAKIVTTKNQIETLALAVEAFYFDCGHYPQDAQGLNALWEKPGGASEAWNGPYISKPVPKDPWGNEYEYTVPGYNSMPFGIRSFGADGLEGGAGNDADICSWL